MPANSAGRDALARFLQDRGVDHDGVVAKLEAYEGLIRRWNVRGNLVSSRDVERLRGRHVLDSLSLLPWCSGSLADVGSGAGFPGVPLAIARPGSPVALIERSERKTLFLRQVAIELALHNVEVIAADVDHRGARPRNLSDLARQRQFRRSPGVLGAGAGRRASEAFGGAGRGESSGGRGSLAGRVFDTVTARAVAPPDVAWKLMRGLLAPDGVALLQSGDRLEGRPFDGGVVRHRERTGGTWVTVVSAATCGG